MAQIQHRTDRSLTSAVTAELAWTPSVAADQVGVVALTNGAVTLSGNVQTYPQKEAAVNAALRVRGVTAVADEIVVQQPAHAPTDTHIAREAGIALQRTVSVPSGCVKATVHDHVITLSGTVDWHYQREAAQRAVATLSGVSGVRNTITLKHPVVSPTEAKATITAALVRHAQLDAQHIQASVDGTEVILTGTVSSWAERRQAEDAAWRAPGVTHVNNQLRVTS